MMREICFFHFSWAKIFPSITLPSNTGNYTTQVALAKKMSNHCLSAGLKPVWCGLVQLVKSNERSSYVFSTVLSPGQLCKWSASCHSPYVKEPASSNNKQKDMKTKPLCFPSDPSVLNCAGLAQFHPLSANKNGSGCTRSPSSTLRRHFNKGSFTVTPVAVAIDLCATHLTTVPQLVCTSKWSVYLSEGLSTARTSATAGSPTQHEFISWSCTWRLQSWLHRLFT